MIDMDDNEFGVLLRPVIGEGEDDLHYGDVEISVFSNTMPDVGDEAHSEYMFLAYKMAAMIQFCDENPEFDDMLNEFTHDLVEELGLKQKEPPKTQPKVTSKKGNVITLNFNTKCEGEG
tara:strand:+ start:313 stop:669 length:357 start_codon:yes stop_codon:yes gene_type:complete